MFNDIPEQILKRMKYLEQADTKDRVDGTEHMKRLRQIPPETGKLLAMLAASATEGEYIEVGTSAGYSTLWLALACRQVGKTITTFEILEDKAKLASETFELTGVGDVVKLVHGDALKHLDSIDNISFCFLDCEKDLYPDCYEMIVPKLVTGGILIADNAISHQKALQPFIDRVLSDDRLDSLVVPIGKGELVCRKI